MSGTAPLSHGQWLQPLVRRRAGSPVLFMWAGTAWSAPSQGNLTLGPNSHRGSTMEEPIGWHSMWLNQDNRCRRVLPRDVCVRVIQGNLMLSPHTCRKPAMGEPIGRCLTRHLQVIGRCLPGQPEQHLVRGTWRWVPAVTGSRPWGNPSIVARCGMTRRTGVGVVSVSTWPA